MRHLSILGSTGSIGTQALEIVRENEDLQIVALTAHRNVDLMEQQIREFRPELAVMYDERAAEDLRGRIRDLPVRVDSGMEGMIAAATLPSADTVITAVVGMIGIQPTIAAIRSRKTIALANKETLVTAGHIIMPLARDNQVSILPVDSEHSAIFQSLHGENRNRMTKILLTASGGPFRGFTREQMKDVTPQMALKHPNWAMGAKITIDSATMVNKGLEVMEAGWLFDATLDQIEVVVHPQSIIHSMVEYEDGGIMAQLGMPDMRLPIQYALFYPDRRPMKCRRVDFAALSQMTFEKPDPETFHGLKLAYRAAREGGLMPTVFNAANEKAVALFLEERLSFTGITDLIGECMDYFENEQNPEIGRILETEQAVYEYIAGRPVYNSKCK